MAYFDTTYTNGVIAVKEKKLLKEKLTRLAELSPDEGFRMLLDHGYGGGAETATSVYDFEKLITAEEEDVDAFIRLYAPSETEQAYLLAPRDFHNAKALIKAAHLHRDANGMLSSDGMISKELLSSCVESGNFTPLTELNAYLGRACEKTTALLKEDVSGSKVGDIFEKALYSYLYEKTKNKPILRKMLATKADMTNVLIALRADDEEIAKEKYLPAGLLKEEELSKLYGLEKENVWKSFSKTPYAAFVKTAIEAKKRGLPLTQAERQIGGLETAYFAQRKYELSKNEPFLYYVYRRRVENANVRIIFVCLLAGLPEREVKNRLRAW